MGYQTLGKHVMIGLKVSISIVVVVNSCSFFWSGDKNSNVIIDMPKYVISKRDMSKQRLLDFQEYSINTS